MPGRSGGSRGRGQTLRERLRADFPGEEKERLLARILCGDVRVDGQPVREPAARVPAEASVEIRERRFVSRGGEKLQAALEAWKIPVAGRVFLDAGASTGGFTDALLQSGAAAVHAVDVGYNQLAWKLRRDERVIVWEKTNIMDLKVAGLQPPPQAAVADLSFRSLRGAASWILGLTGEGWMIALMKPQFEWQRPGEGFDGVVRSEGRRRELLEETAEALAWEGVSVERRMNSPLPGRRGNREYLLLLRRDESAGARVPELSPGVNPPGPGAPQ